MVYKKTTHTETGTSKQQTIRTTNKHVSSIYCVPGMVLCASFVAGTLSSTLLRIQIFFSRYLFFCVIWLHHTAGKILVP